MSGVAAGLWAWRRASSTRAAELALFVPAVPVGIGERVEHLLLGCPEVAAAHAAVARRRLQHLAPVLALVNPPLDSCHGLVPQQLPDPACIAGRQGGFPLESTAALPRLVLEEVPHPSLGAQERSRSRPLDPLLGATVRP